MTIKRPFLIGMIHLPPTLSYEGWQGIDVMIEKAVTDLENLENAGFSAALIENDEDHPCQIEGVADVVTPLAITAHELKKLSTVPLGIEVLLNDPKASLAIAKTTGLNFIRTDYFIDRMMREGYGEFKIDPKGLLEYRKSIKAEEIKIFADVQVKYATMLEKKTLTQSVTEAINAGADGIVVTGRITGEMPLIENVKEAAEVTKDKVPLFVGSGFAESNAEKLLQYADGAIVGSSIKTGRYIDKIKAKQLIEKIEQL